MILCQVFNPNPVFTSVTVTGLTETWVPYIGTGGLLSGSLNLRWVNASERLEISQNTVSISHLTGTALSIDGADNSVVRTGLSTFGIAGIGAYAQRHARGTAANPSAVQANDQLFSIEGWGYGATGYSVSARAMVQGYVSQNWTDANQDTYLSFWTSPNTTIVPVRQWSILSTGNLVSGLDGTGTQAIVTAGTLSATSGTFSGLTPNRVVYVGTAGLLSDSANMTFDGTNFGLNSAPNVAATAYIYSTYNLALNARYAVYAESNNTGGAHATNALYGLRFLAQVTSGTQGFAYGASGTILINAQTSNAFAGDFVINVPSAVILSSGTGVRSTMSITTGSGTTGKRIFYGRCFSTNIACLDGRIDEIYGYYAPVPTKSTGTFLKYSHIKLEDVGTIATTVYAIESLGGMSYHVGNFRIGSTANPTVALDVTGDGLFSATLGVTGLSTLTGGILIASAGNIEKQTNDLTITCAAQKTIVISPTVYDDIQFPIASGKVPAANAPTFETFTTNTSAYSFAVNDYIDLQANELAHWWKEGTNGDAHLHVTTKAANGTGANRFAKFTVVFAYVDTGEVWVEASLTAELTIPNGTSALQAFYLDLGDLTLTNYLIGGQIRCRVTRIAATGGTEYSGNIFITQAGIHLQKDTLGSRQETIK